MPMVAPTPHTVINGQHRRETWREPFFTVYAESDKYELTLYYPELIAAQEQHT